MRVTSASASTNSLVASAASRELCEPVRSEPGMTRIFGDGIGFIRGHSRACPGHPRLACSTKDVDARAGQFTQPAQAWLRAQACRGLLLAERLVFSGAQCFRYTHTRAGGMFAQTRSEACERMRSRARGI